MKKMITLAAIASLAVVGCKSIEVTRHGPKLATYTDTNGVARVALDAKGQPILLDGGWDVDYFQHWTFTSFDVLHAAAGSDAVLDINGYASGTDSNLVALVHTSLDGLTKLTVAIGEAYTKIAGGGAQADTALNVAAKVATYFRDKGGDVTKATVTTSGDSITVTDGSTAITCDSSGNCTDISP